MENALRKSEWTDCLPTETTSTTKIDERSDCSHLSPRGESQLRSIGHKKIQCVYCKLVTNGMVRGNEQYYVLHSGEIHFSV